MRKLQPRIPRLERRRLVDRAWQRFVEEGIDPAGGVGDEIARSWRRTRDCHGIDPTIARPARVLSAEALAERRAGDEVFRIAEPVLADFAARLGVHEVVLAYLDAEGWMLSMDGDRHIVDQVEAIDFRPGAHWAEEAAGTNGPGTALAEAKPVEVLASEHFVAAWHPWSCAAAPIFAPGGAAPVGVVDITGPWEVQRRHALLVAKAIARVIEERLRAAMGVREEVVRYAFRSAQHTGDALVAVDAGGGVIGVNDAAVRRRIVEAGTLAPSVRSALTAALRSRRAEIDADVRLDTPDGRALFASPVRYEGTSIGAIVRASSAAPAPRAARGPARPSARYDFCRILGRSEALRRAVELARTAARNDLPVVVCGESGTGKELFAHAVHCASGRQGGPFVAVNCGSIPAQLVETELFGYEPGTFTGARREGSPGRFEDAAGGTLFLDEVSELPGPAQTALLRVLQEREVVRLGGSTPRPLDVRVVAATNKPLEAEVRAGRFRRDLYYRLCVLTIAVPPLRDRGDDVALLAQVFLAEAEMEIGRQGLTMSADALSALRAHRWPGNVRELRNVILRAAATAPGPHITSSDLAIEAGAPDALEPNGARRDPARGELRCAVDGSEREALVAALESSSWNYARAAARLGISRMTLYRRLQKHGISRAAAPR